MASSSSWVIPVTWQRRFLREGWVFPPEFGPEDRLFTILETIKLRMVPRDLWDSDLTPRFKGLVAQSALLKTWATLSGDPRDKVLLLDFPAQVWNVAWELLVNQIEAVADPSRISLLRTSAGAAAPFTPSQFPKPLVTLVLTGHPGGRELGLAPLETPAEVETIQQAWKDLESGARGCIACPVVEEARVDTLPGLLRDQQPDLLWFTGHGRTGAETELLFNGDTPIWVSAAKLAELVAASGHKPLYGVFSACSTAEAAKAPAMANGPDLFEQLSRQGMISLLAMQAPISIAAARALTQQLFRYFAAGLPLELALARTRAYLLANPPAQSLLRDWACPVVWSAGLPVDRLVWNPQAQSLAQLQAYGHYILAGAYDAHAEVEASVSAAAQTQADAWASRPLTWIVRDTNQPEYRQDWISTLQAVGIRSTRFVLAVELKLEPAAGGPISGQWQEALRDWADSISSSLRPGDFGVMEASDGTNLSPVQKLARAIDVTRINQPRGWAQLCAMEGMFLAVANPPPYSEGWFWDAFLSLPASSSGAIFSPDLNMEIADRFQVDKAGQQVDAGVIADAYQQAPRLARAIATLGLPLAENYLTLPVGPGQGVGSIAAWPNGSDLLEKTATGLYFMTATASQYVKAQMEQDGTQRLAHEDCLQILSNPNLVVTPQILEQRFNHTTLVGDTAGAKVVANSLFGLYFNQNRPYRITVLARRLGQDAHNLSLESLLIISWAYLKLSGLDEADFWLAQADLKAPEPPVTVDDFLNTAWLHGLRGELYKTHGTEEDGKVRALKEVWQAVRICEEGLEKYPSDRILCFRWRSLKQDLAEIMHFLLRDLSKAAAVYQELVTEWNRDQIQGIDLAIVKLNYAACLFDLAEQGTQPDPTAGAKTYLQEAEDLAARFPEETVLADVLYEKAKLAEREDRLDDAAQFLAQCQAAALASHYSMLYAIAGNRLFWLKGPYTPQEWPELMPAWKEVEAGLASFPDHGWAVRALLDSRLAVAHLLEKAGDLPGALAELDANYADLDRNPAYNTGTDRGRIARTWAGLQVLKEASGAQDVKEWQTFLERYTAWAGKWLAKHAAQTAQEVWALERN